MIQRFLDPAVLAGISSLDLVAKTKPGATQLTRMLNAPSSIASDFVNPITPHFDAT